MAICVWTNTNIKIPFVEPSEHQNEKIFSELNEYQMTISMLNRTNTQMKIPFVEPSEYQNENTFCWTERIPNDY